VARYGQAFKDRAVARLLPPESASIGEVSLQVGVAAATLERWRSDALSKPARPPHHRPTVKRRVMRKNHSQNTVSLFILLTISSFISSL
jgi:transposase-like protein